MSNFSIKIKWLEIHGLHGLEKRLKFDFNDDINILTGRNGSGKTTILKLLWYLISANIERAIREIGFDRVEIQTDPYNLTIQREFTNADQERAHYRIVNSNNEVLLNDSEAVGAEQVVEEANRISLMLIGKSLFFPTFRRIEGGFSMTSGKKPSSRRVRFPYGDGYVHSSHSHGDAIQKALTNHADRLSVGGHRFVASMSTLDIQRLVTQRHSRATDKVESSSKSLSESIFKEIRNHKRNKLGESTTAEETLESIREDVEGFERVRDAEFRSLTILSKVVEKIFDYKGIKLSARVTLGEVTNSVNSDVLSAGEKQVLGFLCYNAFYDTCPYFIDEPELSLHADWQRMLLGVLTSQSSNNQYFIATHSPFIYTQYTDKEIKISSDRGDNGHEF